MTTPKLNASREAWIAALRSGKYEQGKSRLKRKSTNAFCCLGVMCEISTNATYKTGKYDTDSYYNVAGVVADTALETVRPEWMSEEQEYACIAANDGLDWTFDQIADWWEFGDGATTANEDEGDSLAPYFPALHPESLDSDFLSC